MNPDHIAHYMSLPVVDRISTFAQWVKEAMPRKQCVYHEGHLLASRHELCHVARLANEKRREGWIALTQFKIAEDRYLYIATKLETRAKDWSYG